MLMRLRRLPDARDHRTCHWRENLRAPEADLFLAVAVATAGAYVFDRAPAPGPRRMWLVAVCALVPASLLLLFHHYRCQAVSLWRRAQAWTLWLSTGQVRPQSLHAFVFSQCTHGRVDSVLQTFDLYHSMFPSLSIGAQAGEQLDEVVRRVMGRAGPSVALELGTHCGYSSVRMLRLLPPGGRLLTVEQEPLSADCAEELIMVAGFKHRQFQVLTGRSCDLVPVLPGLLGPEEVGFSLVLMDHDPGLFLSDLQALEGAGLLRPGGCSVLFTCRDRATVSEITEYAQSRLYSIYKHSCLIELSYRSREGGS